MIRYLRIAVVLGLIMWLTFSLTVGFTLTILHAEF